MTKMDDNQTPARAMLSGAQADAGQLLDAHKQFIKIDNIMHKQRGKFRLCR